MLLDYDALYLLIQKRLWDAQLSEVKAMDPMLKRLGITVLVAGWILAGCDYAEIVGLNAAMVMNALPGILQHSPELVDVMRAAFERDREALHYGVPRVLRHIVSVCRRNYERAPRARKQTLLQLESYDDVQLRRAAWCTAYWSGWEVQDDLHEFGFFRL